MAYDTRIQLTPQKFRHGAGDEQRLQTDGATGDPGGDVNFPEQDMLCANNPNRNGFVVPLEYFSVANGFANEAAARTAANANMAGMNTVATKAGESRVVTVYGKGVIEYECDPATFNLPYAFLMPAYDTTNQRLMSQKWIPTATKTDAWARVSRKTPIGNESGNQVKVMGAIDVRNYRDHN